MSQREWDESDVKIRSSKRGSRPRTKDRPEHKNATDAQVIAVDRGRYTAVVDEGTEHERLVKAVRAKELHRQSIVPCDQVSLVGDTTGAPGSLARLVKIHERSTLLRRSADDTDPHERVVVANVSRMVIVVAAKDPQPRTGFIDRALVAAFDAGITPILCITKTDLREPSELVRMYHNLGVQVVCSAREASGTPSAVAELRELLSAQVSVLLGPSGVGKSTLVNALTGAERDTGVVNHVTGRGRHTSSSARALKLPEATAGSWIIDTPGIRSFGLAHVPAQNIVSAFTELVGHTAQCPRGCLHFADSPGCALQAWALSEQASDDDRARLDSLRTLMPASKALEGSEVNKELGVQ